MSTDTRTTPKPTSRAKLCIASARAKWGEGWSLLTPEMREAYVCREIVYMMLGQATISEQTMRNLIADTQSALQAEVTA